MNQPSTSPTTAANTCGGTTFTQRALIDAIAKIRARRENPQDEDLRVHLHESRRCFAHDAPKLVLLELVARTTEDQRQLLGDDQKPDRREHPLDHRGGEYRREASHLEPGQNDLH